MRCAASKKHCSSTAKTSKLWLQEGHCKTTSSPLHFQLPVFISPPFLVMPTTSVSRVPWKILRRLLISIRDIQTRASTCSKHSLRMLVGESAALNLYATCTCQYFVTVFVASFSYLDEDDDEAAIEKLEKVLRIDSGNVEAMKLMDVATVKPQPPKVR